MIIQCKKCNRSIYQLREELDKRIQCDCGNKIFIERIGGSGRVVQIVDLDVGRKPNIWINMNRELLEDDSYLSYWEFGQYEKELEIGIMREVI